MNILLVDQYSEIGGAQRCLLDLLPAITERGWRACVALPGDGPLTAELQAQGTQTIGIPCGPYSSGTKMLSDYVRFAFDLPRAAATLRRAAAEHGFDLVYVNGPRVLPAARLCGVPLVFHAHLRLARPHDIWATKRSLRGAGVIAASEFAAAPLRSFAAPVVIPNGTSDLGFRAWRNDASLRVAVVGRIAPEKGQVEFVEAVRLIYHEVPQCRFVICGEPVLAGPEYAREVRRRSEGLPIDFPGWRHTPADALAEVDVLVVPSESVDAAPRVIVEAFSAGVPVVAFASGGIPELIDDERTGFLVRPRTSNMLAARLKDLLYTPMVLAAAARRARREWEEKYTVERFRSQVLGVLESSALRKRIQNTTPETTASKAADLTTRG